MAHKQAEKRLFRIVTFSTLVVLLMLLILFSKLCFLCLFIPFCFLSPYCAPSPSLPAFCNPLSSMCTTTPTNSPATLISSPSSLPPLSAFIYIWLALTVFLWWITLSSCRLLSSVTGGEEQQQSRSSSSSIYLSVRVVSWASYL